MARNVKKEEEYLSERARKQVQNQEEKRRGITRNTILWRAKGKPDIYTEVEIVCEPIFTANAPALNLQGTGGTAAEAMKDLRKEAVSAYNDLKLQELGSALKKQLRLLKALLGK